MATTSMRSVAYEPVVGGTSGRVDDLSVESRLPFGLPSRKVPRGGYDERHVTAQHRLQPVDLSSHRWCRSGSTTFAVCGDISEQPITQRPWLAASTACTGTHRTHTASLADVDRRVQIVPETLGAIKQQVDQRQDPEQFIVTGSVCGEIDCWLQTGWSA